MTNPVTTAPSTTDSPINDCGQAGLRPPRIEASSLPWLTEAEMVEVDRVMTEDLTILLIQMMENAGRNLAMLAMQRYEPTSVVVLAGGGGNGGGGLVAARHLANRGLNVAVVAAKPFREPSVPAHQFEILKRMGVPIMSADQSDRPPSADLVIDALIGYSLRGTPTGRAAELIGWANDQRSPILSLDTPSGLNVTDGSGTSSTVKADATMTLAAPKIGLADSAHVGDLYVADISVPASVYARLGLDLAPDFSAGPIVAVD